MLKLRGKVEAAKIDGVWLIWWVPSLFEQLLLLLSLQSLLLSLEMDDAIAADEEKDDRIRCCCCWLALHFNELSCMYSFVPDVDGLGEMNLLWFGCNSSWSGPEKTIYIWLGSWKFSSGLLLIVYFQTNCFKVLTTKFISSQMRSFELCL